MAGAAAAELHPEFARAQIDLVMYDDDLRRQDLEKSCSFADGLAGKVHKGLRLEQQHPLAADRPLREFALEPTAKSRAPCLRAIASTAMKPTLCRFRA